jgi:peptide/nickel transport system permease protein
VNALLAIGAVWWPVYTRIARGETLSLKEQNFVLAARASGLGRTRIIVSHIIPNVATTTVAYATGDIGNIIILFSVLGYLGLGAQPPLVDLGRIVYDGQNYIQVAPWYSILPGAVVFVVCVCLALVGDMMGDLLNPKLRR